MRENADQDNSEYGHFLRSVSQDYICLFWFKSLVTSNMTIILLMKKKDILFILKSEYPYRYY